MKEILFTADLHLNINATNPRSGRSAMEDFAEAILREKPDVVVVAGDIGAAGHAARHLTEIRNAVGNRPLAITLGNHDFWLSSIGHAQFSHLDQVVTRFWREPARDLDIVLLDRKNLDLGEIVVAGCYGHFDLGHAEPGLQVGGVEVTEAIYLSGGMDGLFWNDFRFIPNCATRIQEEAMEQASGLACRMDAAITSGKRLLVAVHTCPWRELNGHPLSGDESDILAAYSGNSLLGKEIERRAGHVDFLVCGHTHVPVPEQELHSIRCLNVGADYGRFRGVIYDADTKQIRWVGEPVPDAA